MKKEKVMIVDDEPNVLELLSAILKLNELEVITAGSGTEALEKLNSEKPDLLMLDIMMPGMSGFDVCEKIRSTTKTSKLKVIFLTALSLSVVDKSYLRKLNALDYITKPFDNEKLIRTVFKSLAKKEI